MALIGSFIQLAFAALWFVRGSLASGWPGGLAAGISLAALAAAAAVWGGISCRGRAPRPAGKEARRIERGVTIATVIQLAASCALPFLVSALNRPDLTIVAIAVTIGILLLWLRDTLRTLGHFVAGTLLISVPCCLALFLSGDALTCAAGLATGTILCGSAAVGLRALAAGMLGAPEGAR